MVMDEKPDQKLLEVVDRLETIEALKEALEDVENGRVRPAREAFEELGAKHAIPH
jgi:hypothetical protein